MSRVTEMEIGLFPYDDGSGYELLIKAGLSLGTKEPAIELVGVGDHSIIIGYDQIDEVFAACKQLKETVG